MKNIWNEGVPNTIGWGTVKLFHSQLFFCRAYILYDSLLEWCKNELSVLRKGQ